MVSIVKESQEGYKKTLEAKEYSLHDLLDAYLDPRSKKSTAANDIFGKPKKGVRNPLTRYRYEAKIAIFTHLEKKLGVTILAPPDGIVRAPGGRPKIIANTEEKKIEIRVSKIEGKTAVQIIETQPPKTDKEKPKQVAWWKKPKPIENLEYLEKMIKTGKPVTEQLASKAKPQEPVAEEPPKAKPEAKKEEKAG